MAPPLPRSPMTSKRGQRRMQGIDRHVAAKVRERRLMLGLTLQRLADMLDVTCAQVQKYETGVDRLSSGRLYHIAQALDVGVDYFYQGVEDPRPIMPTEQQRAVRELAHCFINLPSRQHQNAVAELARVMATAPAPLEIEGEGSTSLDD